MSTLDKKHMNAVKKRQGKFWIILTLLELAVSVWLVNIFDVFMTGVSDGTGFRPDKEKIGFLTALGNLAANRKLQMMFLALQAAYLAFYIANGIKIRPSLDNVRTGFLTPDIEVPVPCGNGQHGKERFLTEAEKQELFDLFSYDGRKRCPGLPGNGGIVVEMIKSGGKEYIKYYGGEIHAIILGASGSGKTRRILLQTLWMQMISGMSVVISDVKGEIYYYTSPYAESLGYNVLAFDLRNPKKSVHYNFLQPVLDAFGAGDRAKGIDYTWDLVSCLVGEQKGEPIWYNGECAAIAAAVLIVALEAPAEYRNLSNVYYFLAYMCQTDMDGNMPLNFYLEGLPDNHPAKGVFAMATIAADRTRSSFFTSALGTLRLFTNPNVAEMTSGSDFSLKDVSSLKTVLYMMIPDEKKTLYPLVSLLITQLYQAQVELANENGLRLPVDTDYDLDEAGNFPFIPVLGNMASAGRSRGIRMNLVLQDYQQLEAKYRDDFENIRTNCQLKIYLKSDNEKTLKSISDGLGKYTVEVTNASTSVTDKRGTGTSYSQSASLAGRALMEPAEIGRIRAPYSLCMLTGEYAGINRLPDLSEYGLNRLLGLGDKKHNARLIQEREAARKEREIPEIRLWGIWKEYQAQMEEMEPDSSRVSFL